jgi:radical SAM superfamily enzyme YgiQ (UPF0313 family)
MMTSRGCPRDCVFCGNPYRGRRPRLRSIESVKAEMDYLSGNGVRAIFLYATPWWTGRWWTTPLPSWPLAVGVSSSEPRPL